MTYPNGNYVAYEYDAFDRLVHTVYYNREATPRTVQAEYSYVYNANGALAKQYEEKGLHDPTYYFEYDSLGRVIESRETLGNTTVQRTEHLYDTANRLTAQSWVIGSSAFTESYVYNDPDNNTTQANDGSLYSVTTSQIGSATNHYDALKRLDRQTLSTKTGTNYTKWISYADNGNAGKTQVSSFAYRLGTTSSGTLLAGNTYTYYPDGSIASVTNSQTGERVVYTYDGLGQLEHEIYYDSNNFQTADYYYVYDTAGNLQETRVSGIKLAEYTYGNDDWADLLTGVSINGGTTQTISYVGGNPTNWYNGSSYTGLTWVQGRRLASLSAGSTAISYAYDMDGIRESKTVGGVTHSYITQSGRPAQESWGTNVLQFVYDTNGRPYALRISEDSGSSWRTYYYILSLQGDVVALIYADGTVCATYSYDAWGKPIAAVTTNVSPTANLAQINPLRYRGYYYDTETGWYYLQSRYYDPIIKRFLNADGYASTGQGFLGYNMFAYCGNNPVNTYDPSGSRSIIEVDLGGGVIGTTDTGTGISASGEGRTDKRIRDVTEEVDAALKNAMWDGFIAAWIIGDNDSPLYISKLIVFKNKVDHGAEWDIKNRTVWHDTIGTVFPGDNATVLYHGFELTPENLGNVTYGVIGRAYGIDLFTLLAGSYVAAGLPREGPALENELVYDQSCIYIGYEVIFPILYEKYYGD